MTILFAFKDSPSIDISFEAGVSVGVGVHAGAGVADEFCGLKMRLPGKAPFGSRLFGQAISSLAEPCHP